MIYPFPHVQTFETNIDKHVLYQDTQTRWTRREPSKPAKERHKKRSAEAEALVHVRGLDIKAMNPHLVACHGPSFRQEGTARYSIQHPALKSWRHPFKKKTALILSDNKNQGPGDISTSIINKKAHTNEKKKKKNIMTRTTPTKPPKQKSNLAFSTCRPRDAPRPRGQVTPQKSSQKLSKEPAGDKDLDQTKLFDP